MKEFKAIRPNGQEYRGVRYREHATRKHGLHPDRYYLIRYWAKGKTQNEGIGWASEGVKPSDAYQRLIDIKAALKAGTYETLAEKKTREDAERAAQEAQNAEAEQAAITFGQVFEKHFLPHSKANKRNERSWQREEALFRLWIQTVIGEKPMGEVAPFDLEKIKSNLTKAGRSARTVHYMLQVVGQVFRYAQNNGLFSGEIPTAKVKRPSYDNQRQRYLTRSEAETLLEELAKRSRDLYDMAAMSLYSGVRAGELFNLTWSCVDFENDAVTLLDTKNSKTRTVFLNDKSRAILKARTPGKPNDLVFPARGGGKIIQISDAFNRAVAKLKMNEGVEDRRQKVTFHTLRHSFASWLVKDGTDLFTVKELLGHADYKMTSRYSHIAADGLRAAVRRLDKAPAEKAQVIKINDDKG
jgi:integrase